MFERRRTCVLHVRCYTSYITSHFSILRVAYSNPHWGPKGSKTVCRSCSHLDDVGECFDGSGDAVGSQASTQSDASSDYRALRWDVGMLWWRTVERMSWTLRLGVFLCWWVATSWVSPWILMAFCCKFMSFLFRHLDSFHCEEVPTVPIWTMRMAMAGWMAECWPWFCIWTWLGIDEAVESWRFSKLKRETLVMRRWKASGGWFILKQAPWCFYVLIKSYMKFEVPMKNVMLWACGSVGSMWSMVAPRLHEVQGFAARTSSARWR